MILAHLLVICQWTVFFLNELVYYSGGVHLQMEGIIYIIVEVYASSRTIARSGSHLLSRHIMLIVSDCS